MSPRHYAMGSVSEARLAEHKLLLVAQLALRRGEFWEPVRDVRAKWGITAERQLPPEGEPRTLYPKALQESNDKLYLWERDLEDIKGKVVHPRYFPRTNWRAFLSLCVLYDPPVPDGLQAFADYGGTRHEDLRWPNPYDVGAVERAAHEELVGALLERFRLAGLDAENELAEALRSMRKRAEKRHVEIPSYDVRELVEEPARRGRPADIQNLAVALECVILQERYGWTYERMAEHYGLDEELAERALQRAQRTRAEAGEGSSRKSFDKLDRRSSSAITSFEKRSDVEAAIRRGAAELAKRDGLNGEVAFAKFSRTEEGQRLKELYDEMPDDEPEPLPVRKVGPGGTGEIAKAARRIASERGISEEAAYAHLPADLLERHRDELAG